MPRLFPLVAAILLVALPAGSARGQETLDVLPVQGDVHVLAGPRGNVTVQTGPEGPLLVDTLTEALSDAVLEGVRALTPRPIRHIVLTSANPQRAGGADALASTGRYVRVLDTIDPRGADTRSSIIAHVNVLNRMVEDEITSGSWPNETYFAEGFAVFSNGEAVQLFHVPRAGSDGDTVAFFRRSDVVSTGMIYDTLAYPRFDPDAGGGIDGILDGLNLVIELAIPGEGQTGGTVVVPGRGRLSDETDVADYRDMVTIVRDRVAAMVDQGMSLAEVRAANPTADYDGVYDRRGNDWTSDMFVDAIFRDLSRSTR
jgi:glyoxylase-like metal-dependent hydrolase (beta-lactamase superfamily II)